MGAGQPKDQVIDINGLQIHYLEWGDQSAPPIVCLHGITQTAHSWDEVAAALAGNFHVFAIDQRGHGDSSWATDGDYRRQSQSEDIQKLIHQLDLAPTIVIGMSMGGINAITLIARYPPLVSSLVIVDVSPEVQSKGVENIRRFIQAPDELDRFEDFVERAHQFNPRRSLDNIRSRLEHNLKQLPSGKWTWKYDTALRSGKRSFQAGALNGLWEDVQSIDCPTLILRGGESDILSESGAQKLQQTIPNSRLETIPGAGHSVMGDNPTDFVRAVESFLITNNHLQQS